MRGLIAYAGYCGEDFVVGDNVRRRWLLSPLLPLLSCCPQPVSVSVACVCLRACLYLHLYRLSFTLTVSFIVSFNVWLTLCVLMLLCCGS
jgi:hypothetical protein